MPTTASVNSTKVDNGALVAQTHGVARGEHWLGVEKAYKEAHPNCIACNPDDYGKVGIQIHHTLWPFHICRLVGRSDGEYDWRNLRSLCETEKDKPSKNHHLLLGHFKNFRSWNPNLDADAITYKGMDEATIVANKTWLLEESARPDPDKSEQREFLHQIRLDMDARMPADPELLKKYNITITPFE